MAQDSRPQESQGDRFFASLTQDGRYRLLVEAIKDYAIYMLHVDGQVSSWNPGAQQLKGYTASEIIGHNFSHFYTPEDRESGLPARALQIAKTEGRYVAEGWRVKKDGSRFWAAVVIDPIRTPEGELVGFAKITRDLTEKREAELALARAREALFQSQKLEAVGKLTGGVAHDFNNLLMTILSSLELAQRRLPEDQKLGLFINNAQEAARRGVTLIQRMLAFARRQNLKVESADLHLLVDGIYALLERSLGPTFVLECAIPRSLPRVLVDINQLESSLINLIVNARDATAHGGTIKITARRDKRSSSSLAAASALVQECVVLSVIDSGEGMDDATLARATEPFFTTKGVGKGTGLGLSMVHGMAEQLGGQLVLKSKRGEGTIAEIWLPIADDECPSGSPVEVHVAQSSSCTPAKIILVVDDDALVRVNTGAMLEELGHRVIEAASGQDALQQFRKAPRVDLVITDQAMPAMTGAELAALIKAEKPGTPILLVSGYAELPEGANAKLPRLNKPYSLDQLADAVSNSLPEPEATPSS